MRYVTIATDAAPTYAVWAPVAARLWAKHGYRVLLLLHDQGWETPVARVILDELYALETRFFLATFPTTGKLNVANTMRCARLVAASAWALHDDDFVLTSDVDMMPLDGAFFQRSEPFVVLRAMFNVWLAAKIVPPVIHLDGIVAGEYRFPMCYCGATVEIWREMFPEIAAGDPAGSLARLVGDRPNAVDLDEMLLSFRFLSSPRAAGPVKQLDEAGVWQKGELTLIDPMTLPNLSEYFNMPRGMLRLHDDWTPSSRKPRPLEALDFIPFRFYPGSKPFDCFQTVAAYFPEEQAWLNAYRAKLDPLL